MTFSPRIVSLVPSVTELLIDLGLGPFVVGRTGFCIHPAAAVAAIRAFPRRCDSAIATATIAMTR